MTRETKIGLLVGLAFIIVIGILLSDHLTSTTEPISAPLAKVGATSREGLTTLGRPTVPAVTIEPPPVIEPRRPVITVEEMKKPAEVTDVIKLGPAPVQPVQPTPFAPTQAPEAGALSGLVNQHAGELEVVGGNGAAQPKPTPSQVVVIVPQEGQTVVSTTSSFKEYKAQEGDTLNKLAGRFLGKNTAANRDAIMRANPAMKGDPNRIVVGRTYLIPTTATTVANLPLPKNVTNAPTASVAPQQPRGTIPVVEQRPQAVGTYWYTVKENDNLWKIASRELGDGNAWTAIKELNKDVLKGGETVRENMRLRLPAKPTGATAAIE